MHRFLNEIKKDAKYPIIYSICMSSIYLPIILGIAGYHKPQSISSNDIFLGVFLINFIALKMIEKYLPNVWMIFVLAPINFLGFYELLNILISFGVDMEGNVMGFTLAFMFIPWIFFFLMSAGYYSESPKIKKSQSQD